jgi:tetratricopeptide (TPR) repeat protein
MKDSLLALPLLCLNLLSAPAVAQYKVGDEVIVVRDTDTRIGKGRCNSLSRGHSLIVEHVSGDWLWLGPMSAGWVKRSDVAAPHDAIEVFGEQIRRDPGDAGAYYGRASFWHHRQDFDRAIADYSEAIRLRPKDRLAVTNRGNCWMAKGDVDRAIVDYSEALRLFPNYSSGYIDRAAAWIKKGDFERAIADCDAALKIYPHSPYTYVWRADAFERAGKFAHAAHDFEKALALDQSNWWALREFARFKATCPEAKYRDGRKAIELATKACEISEWKRAEDLDTLAAACAEAGDFSKAVEWQMKTTEIARGPLKAEFQARCELYKSGRPYRNESEK